MWGESNNRLSVYPTSGRDRLDLPLGPGSRKVFPRRRGGGRTAAPHWRRHLGAGPKVNAGSRPAGRQGLEARDGAEEGPLHRLLRQSFKGGGDRRVGRSVYGFMSWALTVFLKFFNNEKLFFCHFFSSWQPIISAPVLFKNTLPVKLTW